MKYKFEEILKWAEEDWDFIKTRGIPPMAAASIIARFLRNPPAPKLPEPPNCVKTKLIKCCECGRRLETAHCPEHPWAGIIMLGDKGNR